MTVKGDADTVFPPDSDSDIDVPPRKVRAAGQFGNRLRYSSAGGWMDKLKSVGRTVGSNLGDRVVQAVANQGGVTGLLNSPSGMLDAVKSAAMQGVQAALPDVASTVMAAARMPMIQSHVAAGRYSRDENGMPDPISFAAAVYRDAFRRAPPQSALASGRFGKSRPMASARARFSAGGPDEDLNPGTVGSSPPVTWGRAAPTRYVPPPEPALGSRYSGPWGAPVPDHPSSSSYAAGFWDTVGDVASKAAPFAPLLLL